MTTSVVRTRVQQGSHLRHVSNGSLATQENDAMIQKIPDNIRLRSPDVVQHETSPVQRLSTLSIHDESFSRDTVVLEPSINGSVSTGSLLRLVPLKGNVTFHHGEITDGDINMDKQCVFFPKFASQDQLSKQPGLQVSVLRSVAWSFDLEKGIQVLVSIAEEAACSASHVEIVFRDQYLARADMWRLISAELANTCIYRGQKVFFLGTIRATIKTVFVAGKKTSSALFQPSTKPIFRSESARYVLFIQMSKEMWDFDAEGSGEIMFDKVINGFLPELFGRWQSLKVKHLVSIVLFTRMIYEVRTNDGSTKPPEMVVGADSTSRDFYRVVVSDMASGDWATILVQLKKEFLVFLRDISVRKPDFGDHVAPDARLSSSSIASPSYVIAGHPSAATRGNVLEAINLASSQFSSDYIDRDLVRTGVSVIVISPGAGLFEVDYNLLVTTTENLIDNGVGIDLVCLSGMPLHSVPLFKYQAPGGASEDTAPANTRCGEKIEGTASGSFSDTLRLGATWGPPHWESATSTDVEAESHSKSVKWNFGIPHWVDISFWNSAPDESGGTKQSANRKKLKKSSFDVRRHKAFIPRVRMYELQMMGVMENAISDISIPQLPGPFQSQATLPVGRESTSHREAPPRNSSMHSLYNSFRNSHTPSTTHTPKLSGSPASNQPSDKKITSPLREWMDEYDELIFRHPAITRKRIRKRRHLHAANTRQLRDQSPSSLSASVGAQPISVRHSKRNPDRDSFHNQAMAERGGTQRKDISRGSIASRNSSVRSTGAKANSTSRQISFGPRGFGATASKAVASTELSIDHGAASLSRGLKWRPSVRDTTETSAASAHVVRTKMSENMSAESFDLKNADLTPSSESETRKSARPIPIRNSTAARIADEAKSPQPRTRDHLDKVTGVELYDRLAELQDLRAAEHNAPLSEAEDVDDAHPPLATLSPNTTLAPWLTILNPSNPSKAKNSLASRLGRWQHIFPHPLRTSQIKWKSLCSPAAVPLTTEDFPSTSQLSEEYLESVYCVEVLEAMELAEAPRPLITELIAFRLSRGFQIVVGQRLIENVKTSSVFSGPFGVFEELIFTEDCSTIFLSRGNTIHQIRKLNDSKVEVTQLVRRNVVGSAQPPEVESVLYTPAIRSMLSEEYETQEISVAPQRANFNWKMIDSFIVGNERPKAKDFVDNLRPWRARFVLIPVETPTYARRPLNSINEDDDEEIRLEGIRKLSQVWQRFRYVPPEERRFQAPVRIRKDTNPLDIMYQTRNPSAIVAAELENAAEGDASGRPVQLLPESDLYQRSNFKLSALAETIQSEKGVRMLDRRWHWRLHYNCFIGFELTTWLLQNFRDIETRDEAVELGKELMKSGMFKHVQQRHDFRDGNYFYQIADEYRAARPESRGWFGRGKPSVPSTPVSEDLPKEIPVTGRSRASSSSAGSIADASQSTTPTGKKQKLGVALSKSLLYDVDHRKRSYRPELINLHYDRLHNPDNCYHIRIEWMNTTPKLIQDTIISWATSVDRFGLRLVEVPISEASSIASMHPFRSPCRIKLKRPPPEKQPQSYFDNASFSPQPKTQKNYYQKALLKRWGFVLDYEAASDFPPDVDVTYSWGKPDYKYPQYIHRSGRLIAQITDEGHFLLLANRLYNNRGGSANLLSHEVAKSDNPSDSEGNRGSGITRPNPQSANTANYRGSPRLSPSSSPSTRATLDVTTSTPTATRGPSPLNNTSQFSVSPNVKSTSPPTTPESLTKAFETFCNDSEALDNFYEEVLSKASTPGPNTPFLGSKTPSRGPISTPSKGPEKLLMESSIPSLALPETVVNKRINRELGQGKVEKD